MVLKPSLNLLTAFQLSLSSHLKLSGRKSLAFPWNLSKSLKSSILLISRSSVGRYSIHLVCRGTLTE